jgi:signal transduction histidine kinase
MDKLKLKWRIFAFLLGFCALLIAILWIFQTALLTGMYKMIRRAEIEQAMSLVEKNIDSPDLQSVLADLGASKEILVAPTQEFSAADRPGPGNPGRRQMETVTETKEFIMANGQTVSLTFYAIITPVEATVSTLRVQLYIIIGIMFLCSIVLAGIIARRISKPIEEINESAKVLASGNYDTHFAGHGFLEIKELSDTLNTAAAELSQVDNLRRELMANISHDLRTPLALIYSYAEMMHDFPGEVTPEQSETIMNETKRLTSLVNDVLDASRLETGDTNLRLSTYNLTESINDTVLRTAELVKKDGYSILFEYESEVYVIADEIKITQAFYNLLTNAIHYCVEDKNIIVRQGVTDGKVKISVIDCGDGITPENLPHIWDRYYKVNKKHKRAITGTGLGLSIVKKIIELHDGTYGVISDPGKGSTFWFELNMA